MITSLLVSPQNKVRGSNSTDFCDLNESGLAALIEKCAMEFRKSIINDNGLTRRNDRLPYSVKKIKILIVKSKMAAL